MAHPYASLDQVLTAFKPALTAIGVNSFDVTSVEVNSYYIYSAQGVVDAYAARRYITPLEPVPAVITKLTVDLAIYDLFRDKSLRAPDFMNDRYEQAISMLKDISEGKINLPGATETASGDNFAYSTGAGYHPTFSPVLDETDQTVDSDFVNDELDDRFNDVSSL